MKKLDKVLNLAEKYWFTRPSLHQHANLADTNEKLHYSLGSYGCSLARNIETELRSSILAGKENILLLPSETEFLSETPGSNIPTSQLRNYVTKELSNITSMNQSRVLIGPFEKYGIGFLTSVKSHFSFLTKNTDQLPRWKDYCTYFLHHFAPQSYIKTLYYQWSKERLLWWKRIMNNNPDISEEKDNISNEIKYNFSWAAECIERINILDNEVVGIDHHDKNIGCLEITFEVEKAALSMLYDAYEERVETQQTVLQLHPRLAPIQIAILVDNGNHDVTYSLGKRLRKELQLAGISCHTIPTNSIETISADLDAIGTPYSIFIDTESSKSGIVPLRHRNTAILEYIHISEVQPTLSSFLKRR